MPRLALADILREFRDRQLPASLRCIGFVQA
jgi:hypothetical protein